MKNRKTNPYSKFLLVFLLGYVAGDLVQSPNIPFIGNAAAEVAGMNRYDLKYDWDFRSAVKDVVEDCDISVEIYDYGSGVVDLDADISC